MSDELDLGNLAITITDGEPAEAKFDLPNGMSITRTFPESGTINMRLGLGLSLSHGRPPAAGGGGGEPEWVPEGATLHIDFVRAFNALDAAWTAADGIIAVNTLVGSDANTENGWGATGYDAGRLTANGYEHFPFEPPALIGAARTTMVEAGTLRAQFKQLSGSFSDIKIVFIAADGNDAIEIGLTSVESATAASWEGSLNQEIPNCVTTGVGASNSVAFTIVSNRFDMAANGSTAVTSALDATDLPPGNPLVAWLIDTQDQALQSITIYDALPDTTGLSALSVPV